MKENIRVCRLVAVLLVAILFAAGCSTDEPAANNDKKPIELTISAATSLTDALHELVAQYESEHSHVKISLNLAASGALQQQIEQGAPVDLFITAAPKHMKTLVEQQLVAVETQRTMLTNKLVVVVPTEAQAGHAVIHSMADLAKPSVRTVAIGIPDSVPAGSYAKEALVHASLWNTLQPKVVQAKDVRQVLSYVETGNADAGFVYKTDAKTSSKVRLAFEIDQANYPSIEYPIGIIKSTKQAVEAQRLYEYLLSEEAMDVFMRYGFSSPQAP
ncbi:molybdate ABC transporter substrate-binding protein [Paenibacillus sp. YYML68]|uniref:molybdate ABC transporter substrate-binding protein n=1 Tax=Paenibacillus sp. YYML68 TaxID=2909250 RepID=UPI0024908C18|nr:molybdate ABC transporter substrate-binding protein [Paenibacillus sp. YYML68]